MSTDNNKLEKATFIKIYDRDADAVTVTRQKSGALPLGDDTREASTVQACIEVHYCFERSVMMIETVARNTEHWRLDFLPARKLEIVGGLTISDAVDECSKRKDEWAEELELITLEHAPGGKLPDVIDEPAPIVTGTGDAELDQKLTQQHAELAPLLKDNAKAAGEHRSKRAKQAAAKKAKGGK